jgi:hypothetical protein
MRASRLLLAALVVTAAVGCTSPEATRLRAGGPGADVGNHGSIQLHAGADPFYGTPIAMPKVNGGPVAASPRDR